MYGIIRTLAQMDNVGFQKLDVIQSSTQKLSQMSSMRRRKRKINFKSKKAKIIGGFLGVLLIIVLYTGIRAFQAYQTVKQLTVQAQKTKFVLSQQDVVAGKDELVKTQTLLKKLDGQVNSMFYLKAVPFVSWYYNDAQHGINAAEAGVNAGITTTEALIPYADVLGLKGGSGFTGGSAEDRIRLTVKSLGKVVPKIDDIEKDILVAQEEIDKINPNHYPNVGKFKEVRAQIIAAQNGIDDGAEMVAQGKPLIKVLPDLMGEKEPKKYLVLFQNDKELRPTGGFLTYYAIFKVQEGVITVDKSSDIYELDDSISSHPAAPDIFKKYLEVNRLFIRDSNFSPDFAQSVDNFMEQYENSPDAQEVDGVIAIDTHFLVSIIKILDGIEVGGTKFTADIDPRCDCPQVIYEMENNISRPVNYVKVNRKGLVGDMLLAIMQKSLASDPSQYWGRLFQQGLVEAQNKHILVNLFNKDAQKGIDGLNWGGKVRAFEGDYVYINDANLGGQKSNLYVKQNVKMDYLVKDGKINKTITITYRNPRKHDNCDEEAGQLCLNATLRNFQRVYVPKGSKLESSKGSEVKVITGEEFGKTEFESFLTVKPLGKAEISYTYTLPFDVKDSDTLPVLIQKQPGTDIIPYEISVNGKTVEKFDLIGDKVLDLKI